MPDYSHIPRRAVASKLATQTQGHIAKELVKLGYSLDTAYAAAAVFHQILDALEHSTIARARDDIIYR